MKASGRAEKLRCCRCHLKRKASNRSYCKTCWAEIAREKRMSVRTRTSPTGPEAKNVRHRR